MANVYKLQSIQSQTLSAGDLMIVMGTTSFNSTEATTSVTSLPIDYLVSGFVNSYGGSIDADDSPLEVTTPGELTSNTITITRLNTSGKSGLTVYYLLFGRKGTVL